MKKLGLLFVTIIMMMLFAVSANALEATGQCGENVYWTYDETTKELVISGEGAITLSYYYGGAFAGSDVETVVIENGVTAINSDAFHNCSNLTSVTIPDTVTSIGDHAFAFCEALPSITIPGSVTSIGDYAFVSCYALTDVTMENGVEIIGGNAFNYCHQIKEITIPDSVKTIGQNAFVYCEGLTSINLGNGVETIGDSAFAWCKNLESVTIPDSVTYIGERAFSCCGKLTDVVIGNSVETIDKMAFYFCANVKTMHIPASLTDIGQDALSTCIGLTTITVDENNPAYSSDENGILFNKDKTALLQYPASRKNTSYTVPENVTSLGMMAFTFCKNLRSVTMPGTVDTITPGTFYICFNLEEVIISDGINSIEQSAFVNNIYLERITIKDMDVRIDANSLNLNEIKVVGLEREEFIDYYRRYIESGGDEAVLDEFEDHIVTGLYQAGTIYCHPGSTAEAYAIENGVDYVLTHFYEDEWQNGDDKVCRYRKCIHCDEKEVIEHDMSEYVVSKEATCTEKGEERADCANCDYYITREIPVIDHYDENYDGYCDGCGEYIADENCLCVCHAKTIGAFVYKLFKAIDRVFKTTITYKVFGVTDICTCGIRH